MMKTEAQKFTILELARNYCNSLLTKGINNWVISGLNGIEEGLSRDLDVLTAQQVSPNIAVEIAEECVLNTGWNYLGLDDRGYGHLRIFFVNLEYEESYEIDLMPDFMFGPVNVCEGIRDPIKVKEFLVCRNAAFAKSILIKWLSGNSSVAKNSLLEDDKDYIQSAGGENYLVNVLGRDVYDSFREIVENNNQSQKLSRREVVRLLVIKELRFSVVRFFMRALRWAIFEYRRKGGFGFVVPVLQLSNADKEQAIKFIDQLESGLKSVIPFSKFKILKIDKKSIWNKFNLFSLSRSTSANLNMAVELVGDEIDAPHLLSRGAKIYIDGSCFNTPSDVEVVRNLALESFTRILK